MCEEDCARDREKKSGRGLKRKKEGEQEREGAREQERKKEGEDKRER